MFDYYKASASQMSNFSWHLYTSYKMKQVKLLQNVLCCGDELFLPQITTLAMELMAVITHFHIPFVSSNID